MNSGWSRRGFLGRLVAAGAAGVGGSFERPAAAEPPPETTTLRLLKFASSCQAPLYVTEDLLRLEGFTDIRFVPTEGGVMAKNLAAGEVDLGMNFIAPNLIRIDAGDPVVVLAGGHVGCFELFARPGLRAPRDLKGQRVGLSYGIGGPDHVFLSAILTYVGLDPQTDVRWVENTPADNLRLFEEGRFDAVMLFPPETQELRAKGIGRLLLSSANDRPWSQYFCCMVAGHRDFVRKYPVATKRALRAILKGADLCALEPDRAARMLVDRGFSRQYQLAAQLMRELPYGRWRDYHPADTVRFYALRLHEARMIRSSPQRILAQGTDWRFLDELKRELKG